jgi:Cytochrome c551/c552
MRKAFVLFAVVLVSVAFADQKLAQQKGCNACHGMKEKKVGPSFADIAKKYADKPDAVDYLAGKIKKGGSGVWGSVPMPPQNVSDAEAKQLAKWILTVNSQK